MKHFLKAFGLFIIWNTLLFFALSFYNIDFNIKVWDKDGRFVFSFIGIGLGSLASLVLYFISVNDEN